MQLFEMQGLLAGKCLPGDLIVNESIAEYLLRKLEDRNELERQLSAKTISEQNIINAFGISGEGAHSKLVIEYVHGLVAENADMRKAIDETIGWQESVDPGNADSVRLLVALQTPATDELTAELLAQGVGEFAADMWKRGNELVAESAQKSLVVQVRLAAKLADNYVDNMRAGRKG